MGARVDSNESISFIFMLNELNIQFEHLRIPIILFIVVYVAFFGEFKLHFDTPIGYQSDDSCNCKEYAKTGVNILISDVRYIWYIFVTMSALIRDEHS